MNRNQGAEMESTEHDEQPPVSVFEQAPAEEPVPVMGEPEAEEATPTEEPPTASENSTEGEGDEGPGLLVGTASELAPGVGGVGDHPAPAVMVNPEDGSLHVAGEPPNGLIAGSAAPSDDTDPQSGDVSDPEALAKLNAVQEPEPFETKRPDIGTE